MGNHPRLLISPSLCLRGYGNLAGCLAHPSPAPSLTSRLPPWLRPPWQAPAWLRKLPPAPRPCFPLMGAPGQGWCCPAVGRTKTQTSGGSPLRIWASLLLASSWLRASVHSPYLLSVPSPASSLLLGSVSPWLCPFPSLFSLSHSLFLSTCLCFSLLTASHVAFAGWSLPLRMGLPQSPPAQGPLGDPMFRERTTFYGGLFAEKPQLQPPPAQ